MTPFYTTLPYNIIAKKSQILQEKKDNNYLYFIISDKMFLIFVSSNSSITLIN